LDQTITEILSLIVEYDLISVAQPLLIDIVLINNVVNRSQNPIPKLDKDTFDTTHAAWRVDYIAWTILDVNYVSMALIMPPMWIIDRFAIHMKLRSLHVPIRNAVPKEPALIPRVVMDI